MRNRDLATDTLYILPGTPPRAVGFDFENPFSGTFRIGNESGN